MNLISETYNYMKGRVYIYSTSRISNNYPCWSKYFSLLFMGLVSQIMNHLNNVSLKFFSVHFERILLPCLRKMWHTALSHQHKFLSFISFMSLTCWNLKGFFPFSRGNQVSLITCIFFQSCWHACFVGNLGAKSNQNSFITCRLLPYLNIIKTKKPFILRT